MQTQSNLDDDQAMIPIDTLVHLGAGRCSELDLYLAQHPKRVLLVEADPQLAEALQRRTAGLSQVAVNCVAVAGHSGPAIFHRYNLPEAGSLHLATGLVQLFPGLKTVERLPVEAVSPAVLLQPLQLQAEQENQLVIDLPGEELSVLRALQQAHLLHLFRQIQLHCGRASLYEGSEPAAWVLQWLKEDGFDLVAEDASQDPDRPCWTLQRSALQLRNRELQQRVEGLQAQLEELTRKNGELARQAAAFQTEVQQLKQEADTQGKLAEEGCALVEQLTKARDEQAKQTAERQAQLEELVRMRDGEIKAASDLKAQLERATLTRDELTRQAADRLELIESLTRKLDESAQQVVELQAQVQSLTQERDVQVRLSSDRQKQIAQLTLGQDEQAKLATERKQQVEQLTKARDEQKQLVEQLAREKEEQAKLACERQTLLDKVTTDNAQHLEKISESLKHQQDRLDKMEQGLKSQLSKGLENSTKQIESFIGIQTYLTRGQLIPAMHGWPVSPDFALYLINLIETNNYDLILEFGSGASTVLMASVTLKQVQRQAMRQFQLAERGDLSKHQIAHPEESEDINHYMAPAISEHLQPNIVGLPPRIISFEHHHKYVEETHTKLRQAGVAELVELNHAPLRDHVTFEGEHFLYYACEERIAAQAKLLSGRRAKILVLVDGPPGSTGKHARYPALPIILQHMAAHKLDVLMDDYGRQEEKEIVGRWLELLSKRALKYTEQILNFEKGASLLSIG